MAKTWAFVDRAGADGALVGSVEEVDLPEPVSEEARQAGRALRDRRLAARLGLYALYWWTNIPLARLSDIERGYVVPTAE